MSPTGFTEEGPDSPAAMEHAFKWIVRYGGGLAFILIIAWPCLALPAGVFSKGVLQTLLSFRLICMHEMSSTCCEPLSLYPLCMHACMPPGTVAVITTSIGSNAGCLTQHPRLQCAQHSGEMHP